MRTFGRVVGASDFGVLNAPVDCFWSFSNISCSFLGSLGGAGPDLKAVEACIEVLNARRERRRGRRKWVRRWAAMMCVGMVYDMYGACVGDLVEQFACCSGDVCEYESKARSQALNAFIIVNRTAACGANRNIKWQRKCIFVDIQVKTFIASYD
jgi:hypothetical protein